MTAPPYLMKPQEGKQKYPGIIQVFQRASSNRSMDRYKCNNPPFLSKVRDNNSVPNDPKLLVFSDPHKDCFWSSLVKTSQRGCQIPCDIGKVRKDRKLLYASPAYLLVIIIR